DRAIDHNIERIALVALSTFLQTKTTVTPTTDERARAQQQMMTFLMPIMLAFFALNLPSGVSLYWIVSGIVSIGSNVAIYGVPSLRIQPLFPAPQPTTAADESTPAPRSTSSNRPARTTHGPSRSKRKNRRRRS
ncbi:MAG: YidC/Oxa1 family membrane protein insertase, partial [Dehalococcoidia bacterium]